MGRHEKSGSTRSCASWTTTNSAAESVQPAARASAGRRRAKSAAMPRSPAPARPGAPGVRATRGNTPPASARAARSTACGSSASAPRAAAPASAGGTDEPRCGRREARPAHARPRGASRPSTAAAGSAGIGVVLKPGAGEREEPQHHDEPGRHQRMPGALPMLRAPRLFARREAAPPATAGSTGARGGRIWPRTPERVGDGIARHLPVEEEQDVLVHDVVPGEAGVAPGSEDVPRRRQCDEHEQPLGPVQGPQAAGDSRRAGTRRSTSSDTPIDAADEEEARKPLSSTPERQHGPEGESHAAAFTPAQAHPEPQRVVVTTSTSSMSARSIRDSRNCPMLVPSTTAAAKARRRAEEATAQTGRRRDGAEGCQGWPDAGVLGRSGDAPEGRWQPVHQRRLGEERLPVDPRRDPVAG